MYLAPRLSSIETLQRDRIFSGTQRLPIMVRAEDLRYYVTKVQATPQDYTVVREWIGAHFLKLWGLPVPDFAIIDVQDRHVPMGLHPRLTPYEFSRPAFGSLYLDDVDHVNATFAAASSYQAGLALASEGLIRLALFDRWLCNDDRNFNNYNLLYRGSGTAAGFIPIDHEALFSHGRPGANLTPQAANENLLQTPLFTTFAHRKRLKAYVNDAGQRSLFTASIQACADQLETIISAMPEEWGRLCQGLIDDCHRTIFAPSWINRVWKDHLEQLILSKHRS